MSLMNQVKNEEIVLPAIQRDFVWSQEKVETLLDSIMRGYPIGIILLWETFNDIQYRPTFDLPAFVEFYGLKAMIFRDISILRNIINYVC